MPKLHKTIDPSESTTLIRAADVVVVFPRLFFSVLSVFLAFASLFRRARAKVYAIPLAVTMQGLSSLARSVKNYWFVRKLELCKPGGILITTQLMVRGQH